MPFYVYHRYIFCVLFSVLGAEIVFLPLVFLGLPSFNV